MKVVLFCGGFGMRMREYSEAVPKPMVPIGYRPILWHVMKYYAHFGHKDFILCLGYRADVVKNYFRNYDECVSNDFVLSQGGRRLELLQSDIDEWRITFVDTGINANIGQRLKAVEPYLAGEAEFFANYSDGLTDVPLPAQLERFRQHNCCASFLCVRPPLTCHFVVAGDDGRVTSVQDVGQTGLRINGGFFIFLAEIFDYLRHGEDLVLDAFQRVLAGYGHVQRQAALGRHVRQRRRAVGGLEARGASPGPCRRDHWGADRALAPARPSAATALML